MTTDADDTVGSFLRAIGADPPVAITPLAGGANNRVFRVDTAAASSCVKWFAPATADHDRFAHEVTFVEAVVPAAAAWMPRLLGASAQHHMAQYALVDGARPSVSRASSDMVDQAASFLAAVNRTEPAVAAGVPDAVEPCFTLDASLTGIERRVERLVSATLDRSCRALVDDVLGPTWASVRASVTERAAAIGWSSSATDGPRWLSPSDIGFHNALDVSGSLMFVDFEYAGWDDPAKTIADFFAQPDYEVEPGLLDRFAAAAGVGRDVAARATVLLDVQRVRWACIVLNDFIEPAATRRRESLGEAAWAARWSRQLAKAATMLATSASATRRGDST